MNRGAKRSGASRTTSVGEQIRREFSQLLLEGLKDPRIGFVTVSTVKVSTDMGVATVNYTVLGSDKSLRDTEIGLEQSAGCIRRELAHRLKLRHMPRLEFQLDELIELYAADALVLRSNLPPIRGAMAVREFFFSALEAGLGEVAVEPLRVEVVGDLAHEVGRYSALVPGTAGKRREERGKYLWVFAKQSGGDWKLVSECWSSDLTLTAAESEIPKPAAPAKPQPRRS